MTVSAPPAPPSDANPSLAQQLGPLVVGSRHDLVITRQMVRGAPTYVAHDPVAFRNHALTPLEYRILCSFGFDRSLVDTFDALVRERLLAADDEEEFYEFVLSLHGMGLLVVPGLPADTVWRRYHQRREAMRTGPMRWLVSLRVSFGNPDAFLRALLPYAAWLFSVPGLLLWGALLVTAMWQCAGQFGALFGGAAGLLELQNLPVLWVALVLLKGLHELGHAMAIKRFGGAVPDFGVIFMFLTPCAYVDANASWTFPSRWHRLFVALGGMYVETMIAFVFMLIWLATPPGLLHDVSHSVVVLASITTLLININPLIKFDGYYAFSDLIGVVNLQERAMKCLRGAVESLLLGLPREQLRHGDWERLLIWLYAPASFVYRMSLAVGITSLVLMTWPAVGVVLGAAFAWMLIGAPLKRLAVYLWSDERTQSVRLRARFVTVAGLLAVVLLLAFTPMSRSIVAPGVLDPGVRRSVRAPADAFVQSIEVKAGQVAAAGAQLCRLRDRELERQLLEAEAELRVARVEFDTHELVDPVRASVVDARIAFLQGRLAEMRDRRRSLSMTAPERATVVDSGDVVAGQFVRQGQELMRLHSEHRFVRVVLTDYEVNRTRLEIGCEVRLCWTSAPDKTVGAVVREIRASASRRQLPVELTVAGGGDIYARASGDDVEAVQPYLHVLLEVEDVPLDVAGSGLTAKVRFPAAVETLGGWMKRRLLTFFYNWRLS